jgi:hypothetical protein
MCPEVGLSEEQLKATLKEWTKKDDYRELHASFNHCRFRGNGWLGKANQVDRSSFLVLTIVIITMAMAMIAPNL